MAGLAASDRVKAVLISDNPSGERARVTGAELHERPADGRAKPTIGMRPTITDAGEAHRPLAAGAVAGQVALTGS